MAHPFYVCGATHIHVATYKKMKRYCLGYILLMLCAACGHNGTSGQSAEKNSSAHSENDAEAAVPLDPWKADSLAFKRWGNAASPYRDEERYIAFLDSLLAVDSLPEDFRERAEYRRRIAMLNRPGTIAADFRYLLRDGGVSRLHSLKSPLTLLVFYDPECPHCSDILRSYASSGIINRAVAEKKLTVIAIYAEGKRDVWDKTRNDLPDNWLVGYDLTGILEKEIYDLPAMPTPYLLDCDKRVILKDPGRRQLLERIQSVGAVR